MKSTAKQRLMLHQPFRDECQLLDGHDNFSEAYATYLQTGNIPNCLQDDIHRLEQTQSDDNDSNDSPDTSSGQEHRCRNVEEWMLICQHRAQLGNSVNNSMIDVDWCEAGRAYPNLEEAPTFITRSRESTASTEYSSSISYDHNLLQGEQLQVYEAVQHQLQIPNAQPLRMIVTGTAGTGKSFLIGCLQQLLQDKVRVLAPTGVAAFNVHGCTLHSALCLPTKGEIKSLEGDSLRRLQDSLAGIEYIIIDEMSMVGRKMFGQIDQCLHQAFPRYGNHVLGGRCCLLFGDFGQLPPVMDLPLYTSVSRSALSDLGRSAYQTFNRAVVLRQVMRQQGEDPEQVRFREILLRLRDARVTQADWEHLMTRRDAQVADMNSFADALHLLPKVTAVAEHNLEMLHINGKPVAEIKAVHSGPRTHTASSDDAGGLMQ